MDFHFMRIKHTTCVGSWALVDKIDTDTAQHSLSAIDQISIPHMLMLIKRLQVFLLGAHKSVFITGSWNQLPYVIGHELPPPRMLWITNLPLLCYGSRIYSLYVMDHESTPCMLWITNLLLVCYGSRIYSSYVMDHESTPCMWRITNLLLVCYGSRIYSLYVLDHDPSPPMS